MTYMPSIRQVLEGSCDFFWVKAAFGIVFIPVFRQILKFFFLLKLSAVCTFWIILMC